MQVERSRGEGEQAAAEEGRGGGDTALHVACTRGAVVVAQALLLNGADASRPDEWGLSPLEVRSPVCGVGHLSSCLNLCVSLCLSHCVTREHECVETEE